MMLFLLTRVKIVFHLSGFFLDLVAAIEWVGTLSPAVLSALFHLHQACFSACHSDELFLGYNVQDMSLFTMTQNDTTRVYQDWFGYLANISMVGSSSLDNS